MLYSIFFFKTILHGNSHLNLNYIFKGKIIKHFNLNFIIYLQHLKISKISFQTSSLYALSKYSTSDQNILKKQYFIKYCFFKKDTLTNFSKIYYKAKLSSNYLVNFFFKSGLKLKMIIIFSKIFLLFYESFYNFNDNLNKMFPLYNVFFNLKVTNTNFYNLEYIFKLLSLQNNFLFTMKIRNIPKKLKKKKNLIKYKLDFIYINKNYRLKWLFKHWVLSSNFFKYSSFNLRLFFSFLAILLNPSNSFLRQEQTKTYKHILQKRF